MKPRIAVCSLVALCVLLVALPLGTIAQDDGADQYEILLKSRHFVPQPGIEPAVQQTLLQAGDGRLHMLLQFTNIPDQAQRAELEAIGIQLLGYVPRYAWYASVPPGLDIRAPALETLRWLGAIQPADRLSPSLRQRGVRTDELDEEGRAGLELRFFSDVPDSDARQLLAAHGAEVLEAVTDVQRYAVRCDPAAIDALAQVDGIQWIDRSPPPPANSNDGSRAGVNVDPLYTTPYDLSGTGVDLGQWELTVPDDHVDFGDRYTVGDPDAEGDPDETEHATHVAGTMAGDGSNSAAEGGTANQWQGMAPGADIISFDLGDMIVEHLEAISTYGIELSQNSWSYMVDESWYDNCDLYGAYHLHAADYDKIVTGLYGKRIVTVFSAGNERNDGDCGMVFTAPYANWANIPPPGTAKNVITVGGTNSDDDTQTTFSSWGPLADGRLKPDVVAPGCEEPRNDANPNQTIWSTVPDDEYGGMCGTSMAAPAVSGVSALLIEQFRATIGGDPWPSTVKGLLIQTAEDLDDALTDWHNPGPDYASGYGRIDAQAAVDALRAERLVEEWIGHSQTDRYDFLVPHGTLELKVSLVWDDEPGMDGVEPALVNNLDLVLVDPYGTTYLPWVLDPENPSNDAVRAVDSVNNVEQVSVDSPAIGHWTAYVEGTTVPVGPQSYSLLGFEFTPLPPEGVGPLVYADHQIQDGVVHPNESNALYVWLRNDGSATATGVSAVLSTTDGYVTITDASEPFASIAPGATVRSTSAFDFSTSASTPHGHIIDFDLNVTADSGGPWSDSFTVLAVGSGPGPDVALISDQQELKPLTLILEDMGLTYDSITDNYDGQEGYYTSDAGFLRYYDNVVWYASGLGTGRQISEGEKTALNQFLNVGGNLLVTGLDTLGSPTDERLADVVRSDGSGDGPIAYGFAITDGDHVITNGPYGSFATGSLLIAGHPDHDQAQVGPVWDGSSVASLHSGYEKIMVTEVPSGRRVVYWNGNHGLADWLGVAPSPTAAGTPAGEADLPGDEDQVAATIEGAVLIDFDDASHSCDFADSYPLRDEYMGYGALFAGPGAADGPAILDDCSGYGVSGYSPPNFLAFDGSSRLIHGGVPRGPSVIHFARTMSSVSLDVGSGLPGAKGQPVTLEAFHANGLPLGSDTVELDSEMAQLSVSAAGIAMVAISSPESRFAVDDLILEPDGTSPGEAMLRNTLFWLAGGTVGGDAREPNDTIATCELLPFDELLTDVTIDPDTDLDYFCFPGSQGQRIAAGVAASAFGSALEAELRLFDRQGGYLLTGKPDPGLGADSYLEYTLPADGVYYLRVSGLKATTGDYRIRLLDISPGTTMPYSDDMEAGRGGWVASGLWHRVQEGVHPYAESHSSSRSWWYGQDHTGDYDTGVANAGSLTSQKIAIPAGSEPELRFWQWYSGVEYETMSVQVSTDGSDFVDLASVSGGPMETWEQVTLDLAPYAGHKIQIRFYFDTVDFILNNNRGWYIDDVWVDEEGGVYLPLILSGE